MKVNELHDKTKVDELILEVTAKDEPREVRGGSLKVCNCTGKDDSGSVTVTLWNKDIEKVKVGDKIKITNGWAAVYQDAMQVSSGRFGELEVLDS